MRCPKCGWQLPAEAKFCLQCGAKIFAEQKNTIEQRKIAELEFVQEFEENSGVPDMERFDLENGSGNMWMHYDGDLDVLYNLNTNERVDGADGILMYDFETKKEVQLLRNYNVDSFRVSEDGVIAFIVTNENPLNPDEEPRRELWCCNWRGEEPQHIAGDDKDNVDYYAITDDWIFAVVENKRGKQFIYQIASDLSSATVIKKDILINKPIVADDNFLYYMTGYPGKVTLMQYDIHAKKERAIIEKKGLSRFQLYRQHLIVATYEKIGAMNGDNGEKLFLVSPKRMTQRNLSPDRIHADEINCYLDFIFYTEKETGHIYALPITGDIPQLVYGRRAVNLNISHGLLSFIDYDDEKRVSIPIIDMPNRKRVDIHGYTGYKIPLPIEIPDNEEPDYLS